MPAIIPIPAFADNYIWLLRKGREAAVVDPGDATPVLAYLAQEGLHLTAIITTHHHADHVGGNTALLAHTPVPVFGPATESIPGRTQALREGDRIEVPGIGLALRVLEVPGHTAGHIAYVGDHVGTDTGTGAPIAFVGDTLFACGCGRLFEGTAAQMTGSLGKIADLDNLTRLYCAHEYTLSNLRFAQAVEPHSRALAERRAREAAKRGQGLPTVPSVLADERATNPFLRTTEPGVVAAAEARAGRRMRDRVDTFATLRAWKDGF